MNLRHLAALALVGWYLLMPPMGTIKTTEPLTWRTDAPLAEWQISQSFDKSDDCEKARKAYINNPDNSIVVPADMDKFDAQTSHLNQQVARLMAQCIATDDPRLNPK
jgi:hypothetical protein